MGNASSIYSFIRRVLFFSGRGVIVTPFFHGIPIFNNETASMKIYQENSVQPSYAQKSIFSAVHRCPVK